MLDLRIKYRPLRIGWCVRANVGHVQTALRFNSILWGGRFNPIIPVDDEQLALKLVESFPVDTLYPIDNHDSAILAFTSKLSHLQWPIIHRAIVVNGGPTSQFPPFVTVLDVYHAMASLHKAYVKDSPQPKLSSCLYQWDPADPLSDILLATCGQFPPTVETGIDYPTMMKNALAAQEVELRPDAELPADLFQQLYPSRITEHLLQPSLYFCHGWNWPGLYHGNSQDFDDLVTYRNLRSAGIELYFYDPAQKSRLDPLKETWLSELRNRSRRSEHGPALEHRIAIWAKNHEAAISSDFTASDMIRCTADDRIWNGLNLIPPVVHFNAKSVLAAVADTRPPTATFQLPEKPFVDDSEFMNQHVVVSVHPLMDIRDEKATFSPPFVPELNEYFRHEMFLGSKSVCAEGSGVGVITTACDYNLTIEALDVRQLVQKVFSTFGISATPSAAGRVTSRLVDQMGGLQGCRVFKIAGVRRLIEKYKPDQSFTKSAAVQLIGQNDATTERPQYECYKHLHIEYHPGIREWKPKHALIYLLKKRVLTVGLELRCPHCELKFWRVLDDINSETYCEYCRTQFDVALQLNDRDWAYRRSGLFGRDDHQEGGIAVSVVLQQMHTVIGQSNMLFTTALELSCAASRINCETDLVVLHPESDGRIALMIGECKTRGTIEETDVANLVKVADAFSKDRFDVFLLFAKLAPFSEEEIKICQKAQDDTRPRVILLSDRELEPYWVYELAEKEFVIRDPHVSSLTDMANATTQLYFNPVRKRGSQ